MKDLLIVSDRDLARLKALRPQEHLQHEFDRTTVVSSEAVPPDVVTMGSWVRYVDEASGLRHLLKLVYPSGAIPGECKVSVLTPTGSALLGLSVGQSIEWSFPDGYRRRLRVDKMIHQPESAAASLLRARRGG